MRKFIATDRSAIVAEAPQDLDPLNDFFLKDFSARAPPELPSGGAPAAPATTPRNEGASEKIEDAKKNDADTKKTSAAASSSADEDGSESESLFLDEDELRAMEARAAEASAVVAAPRTDTDADDAPRLIAGLSPGSPQQQRTVNTNARRSSPGEAASSPMSPPLKKKKAAAPRRVVLTNLSDATTADALRAHCEKTLGGGGGVSEVAVPTAGSAVVSFDDAIDAAAALVTLDGANLDGRKLRARLSSTSSGDDDEEEEDGGTPTKGTPSPPLAVPVAKKTPPRYFDTQPTTKAASNKGRRPCALCGRAGHLMDSCPFAVCGRCLRPGHRERDCPQPGAVPPELCTCCGRWGHSWAWCDHADGADKLAAAARCVTCGATGHLVCGEPALQDRLEVYCAWCGDAGHTHPSCPNKGRRYKKSQQQQQPAAASSSLSSMAAASKKNKRAAPPASDDDDDDYARRRKSHPGASSGSLPFQLAKKQRTSSSSLGGGDRRPSDRRGDHHHRDDHHRDRPRASQRDILVQPRRGPPSPPPFSKQQRRFSSGPQGSPSAYPRRPLPTPRRRHSS